MLVSNTILNNNIQSYSSIFLISHLYKHCKITKEMFKVKLFFTWVKYKYICINLSNTHLNIKGFKCSRFGYKFSFDNWNLLILKLFIKNRKPLWFIDSNALPHLLFGQFDH